MIGLEESMQVLKVNQKEYTVINLLGKGKGGYSYLVTDGKQTYVLKQIHHEPCSYYQFGNKLESEVRDYDKLKKIGICMPNMFEVDHEHERILKEFIKGDTIYELIKKGQMKQTYIDQVKHMCTLLYAEHMNIDYFPTNFVVQNDVIYYIDFECNTYMEEWNFENWGTKYWSQTADFLAYEAQHSEKIRQVK